jgi:hypothetical protein
LRSKARSSRQRVKLLQPVPKPRVIRGGRPLGAQLVKSLKRVAVRSFGSVAKPAAVLTRPTIPWTAVAMTAMVSPSRQQQVSPLSPRIPTRSLGAIQAWLLCSTCSSTLQKSIRILVSLRSARSVIMTPVTVPTVNRKLGMATQDLV